PQWFTFDLGVTAKLSRLVLFKRLSNAYLYNSGAVKRWTLYGSNNPNPDGSFDESWIFLMDCNSYKPSGLPPGENTNEDLEYARGRRIHVPRRCAGGSLPPLGHARELGQRHTRQYYRNRPVWAGAIIKNA